MARPAHGVVITILLAAAATAANAQSSFRFFGYLSARAARVDGDRSWLDGRLGRFDFGPDVDGDRATRHRELAQLGMDWTPSKWLLVHGQGIARTQPNTLSGKSLGVVEAYVEVHGDKWHVRAGQFFLPTSRENTAPLWTSPYTLTYSALNTWMGEEVRPIGIDVQWSPNFYVSGGVTVFRGNDTMGTLMAARGWTFGDRLTVYDERVPAVSPKLSKPIGRDLDDENGYAERLRIQLPERAMLQFTHVDNRAPLLPLVRGEEPWRTKFDVVGAEVGSTAPTTVAAEWSRGTTELAFPIGGGALGFFTMKFDTAYLLVSRKTGRERWTVRAEHFATDDDDDPTNVFAHEDGHAVTLAWLHESNDRLRFGLEYVKISGGGPAGIGARDFPPHARGGKMLSAEVRIAFR